MRFGDAIRGPLRRLEPFRDPSTWRVHEAWERGGVWGDELAGADLALWQGLTKRTRPRPGGYRTLVMIAPRRTGKSRWGATRLALDAAGAALAGKRGLTFPIFAQTSRDARRAAFAGVVDVFSVPPFADLVARQTSDELELTGGNLVAVYPAGHSVRGVTAGGAWIDELAFLRSSDDQPMDKETLRAVRPALRTTGGRLYITSSPLAPERELFDLHRRFHNAEDASVVVAYGGTALEWNPATDRTALEEERRADPEAAVSEVDGLFRATVSSLLTTEDVDRCIEHGIRERAPGGHRYFAHLDVAGGVEGGDRAALCILHRETEQIVVDLVSGWTPPFTVGQLCQEAAAHLRRYRLSSVQIDRASAAWVISALRQDGQITAQVHEADTSDNLMQMAAEVRMGRVRLVDHEELRRELVGLERRIVGSRERAGHKRGRHDDYAAALAGAVALAASKRPGDHGITLGGVIGTGRLLAADAPPVRTNLITKSSYKPGYVETAPGVWIPESWLKEA